MTPCHKFIEQMYLNKKVEKLLSSIRPTTLQKDLKQELAIALLNYDCKTIVRLNKEGNLLPLTLRILWNLGTGVNNKFYQLFKKNQFENIDDIENITYFNMQHNQDIPESFSTIANDLLNDKLKSNPNDAHESLIFNKYVELKSCKKVADYFTIPHLHVFNVVKKTRAELKKAIKDTL